MPQTLPTRRPMLAERANSTQTLCQEGSTPYVDHRGSDVTCRISPSSAACADDRAQYDVHPPRRGERRGVRRRLPSRARRPTPPSVGCKGTGLASAAQTMCAVGAPHPRLWQRGHVPRLRRLQECALGLPYSLQPIEGANAYTVHCGDDHAPPSSRPPHAAPHAAPRRTPRTRADTLDHPRRGRRRPLRPPPSWRSWPRGRHAHAPSRHRARHKRGVRAMAPGYRWSRPSRKTRSSPSSPPGPRARFT